MKIARWLAGGGLLGRETGDPRNTDSPFYPIFQRFHLDLLAFGEKAREYTHTTSLVLVSRIPLFEMREFTRATNECGRTWHINAHSQKWQSNLQSTIQ